MIRHGQALLLCTCLAGCAEHKDDTLSPATNIYVRGSAKVVSLEPASGHAVLEFQGRQVDAYWQTERYVAQGGAIVKNDPLKPAVGQYAEPLPRMQTIQAKPGDTITIVGLSTPSGILLRSVVVPE
jgi:hypothetical protein